jgi:arginyl-tRNA--protein-N-Asp/Glu arginylyltransferase
MGYKAEYRPAEVLVHGQWRLLSHFQKTTKPA